MRGSTRASLLLAVVTFLLVTNSASAKDLLNACVYGSGTAAIKDCTAFLERPGQDQGDRELALSTRAQLYLATSQFQQSIADYSSLLQRMDSNEFFHAARSEARSQLQDFDGALDDADEGVRLDPKSSSAHAARAEALEGKQRFDDALKAADRAIKIDPKHFYSHVLRARILNRLGRHDEALVAEKTAGAKKRSFAKNYTVLPYETAALSQLPEVLSAAAAPDASESVAKAPEPQTEPSRPSAPVAPAPRKQAVAEKRIALVIGNSHYASAPVLENPARDATAIADALTKAGFATTIRMDLNRTALTETLGAFAGEAAASDWAIVYFAGHGIQTGGMNYVIPIDAKLATDVSIRYEAVPLDMLTDAVRGARKLSLVVMDACRSDPFVRTMRVTTASRAIGRGLARPDDPNPGMLIAFAARDGEEAADGAISLTGSAAKNSPFAAAFVKEIAIPGVELRRMLDRVSDDVTEATGGHQHPLTYGHISGRDDYFFMRPAD